MHLILENFMIRESDELDVARFWLNCLLVHGMMMHQIGGDPCPYSTYYQLASCSNGRCIRELPRTSLKCK